ncbi:MAG: Asp-tRNA(Asn)/Glu-tRNA(Gln) amidotransferase subunit GatC [Patescibacteria group bacterium]
MALDKEEIQKIAKLARLRIEESEIDMYKEQISSILEYVEKLQELDTNEVPELAFASGDLNVFREDEAYACDSSTRDSIVDQFPQKQGDLLEVQAVFEDRNE